MNVRMIAAEDGQEFLLLNQRLDSETKFMLLEPKERTSTVEQVKERIEITLQKNNEAVFVVEDNNKLVGYASVIGGTCNRNAHKASIVTGILQSHVGKGLGSEGKGGGRTDESTGTGKGGGSLDPSQAPPK